MRWDRAWAKNGLHDVRKGHKSREVLLPITRFVDEDCFAFRWSHGEKCQSFRGKLAYVTIERVSTKNPKKKNGAGQHTFFFTWTWRAFFRQAHERSCKLVISLGFFLGRSVRATSWRKTPKLVLTGCFSSVLKHVSSDTVKGCSSSSWVQCIQFFFSKTLFDFKKSISGLIELKFSEKTPSEVFYAPIYFWGVYF